MKYFTFLNVKSIMMDAPKRINRKYITTIMMITDIMMGLIIINAIKQIHNELVFIFPDSILKETALSSTWENIIFTAFWILLFAISGSYRQIFLKGVGLYIPNFIGLLFVALLFFNYVCFIKNEELANYGFIRFFAEIVTITTIAFSTPRIIYYIVINYLFKKGILASHTIIIGNTPKSKSIVNELNKFNKTERYYIKGYVETCSACNSEKEMNIERLGTIDNLSQILSNQTIDDIIVSIEKDKHKETQAIISIAKQHNITIKLIPEISDILEGSVKMSNVTGFPFITIGNKQMPEWQMLLKILIDYSLSIIALILTLPIIPAIIIGIKSTSKGPVFYIQTRLGKNKKPFKIIKFRSMYVDAEQYGPLLSSSFDPRITPFGRIMRKWRFDEIPQFLNVLKGDMSIVGPRPERRYYTDQIITQAPYYSQLFRIKPGITSWGMVKYGYAENIDQMIERSKYDILYLENMTILVDFKIMLHTIRTVIIGNGK